MTQFAIGYGRKSFDDPDHRTSSVDDQQVFAQAYARQHGMELIAFHSDDGITGATMERPALLTALAALKAGKAKILIIECGFRGYRAHHSEMIARRIPRRSRAAFRELSAQESEMIARSLG